MTRTQVHGGTYMAVAALVSILAASALAQSAFDPGELEWKEKANDTLELKWKRPKHPKWRYETIDVGNGRVLADYIIRAESPSAQPDMSLRLFAWSVQGSFKPTDFPSKKDAELKNLISKDATLAKPEHKEKGNALVGKFSPPEGERVDQRAILDALMSYKKREKCRFGKELEKVLAQHKKKKYFVEVPLNQQDPNGLIKYYHGVCHNTMTRAKISKIGSTKFGKGKKAFKAKTFTAEGMDERRGAKVKYEYYTFGGLKGHTGCIEILYRSGMQDSTEIKIVKKMIMDSIDKM